VRILFNCVVNRKGGSVQNAANYISLAMKDCSHIYLFIVSKAVYDVLFEWGEIDERILIVDHPLESKSSKSKVAMYEYNFSPDLVYTMAGPTYLNFRSKHVLGISDGYITHADLSVFFYKNSFFSGFLFLLKTILKGILARFSADFFVFQTKTARDGFCKRFFLNKNKTYIVQNALGKSFQSNIEINSAEKSKKEIIILCPFADYKHKDIDILERIIKIADEKDLLGVKIKFIVTVDFGSEFDRKIERLNRVSNFFKIYNHGVYSYVDALDLYLSSDIVFMPTILETFSTTYLEAIASGKVLLASDKDFSREICGDAAIYFRAKDEVDALSKIIDIIKVGKIPDPDISSKVLTKYGDYKDRYNNINLSFEFFLNKL